VTRRARHGHAGLALLSVAVRARAPRRPRHDNAAATAATAVGLFTPVVVRVYTTDSDISAGGASTSQHKHGQQVRVAGSASSSPATD